MALPVRNEPANNNGLGRGFIQTLREGAELGATGCLLASIYSSHQEENLSLLAELTTGAVLGIFTRLLIIDKFYSSSKEVWKRVFNIGMPYIIRLAIDGQMTKSIAQHTNWIGNSGIGLLVLSVAIGTKYLLEQRPIPEEPEIGFFGKVLEKAVDWVIRKEKRPQQDPQPAAVQEPDQENLYPYDEFTSLSAQKQVEEEEVKS